MRDRKSGENHAKTNSPPLDLEQMFSKLQSEEVSAFRPTEPFLDVLGSVSGISGYSGYSGYGPSTTLNTAPPLPVTMLSQDPEAQSLRKDIVQLQARAGELTRQLQTEKAKGAKRAAREKSLEETVSKLRQKQKLDFLISRVTPEAEKVLLTRDALRDEFFAGTPQRAFIVSIDMRRSTDLMLKAKSPAHFAAFMTELCAELALAIKREYGVFDKFTGDGVLAFFPEFFSGKDAGYHALMMAQSALSIFGECYRRHRSSFSAVLRDVDVTVGIDFGSVHLVQVAGGLTAVGEAVVYACRLSGGTAGSILLNHPAYDEISEMYGDLCLISETSIVSKHEGGIVCYDVRPNNKTFTPTAPPWLADLVVSKSKTRNSSPVGKRKR